MCKIHEETKGDKEITYDNEFPDPEVLVQVNESVLTSIASHIAHDNLELHAVLRRDLTSLTQEIAGALGAIRLEIVQAVALIELLCLVKHDVFSTQKTDGNDG